MKKFLKGLLYFGITFLLVGGIVVAVFVFSPAARNSYNGAYRKTVGWYEEPRLTEYTLDSLDSIDVKTASQSIKVNVSDAATEITVRYYTNWDGHITDNHSSSLKIEESWKQNWLYAVLPKIDLLVNKDVYIPLEITVPKNIDLTRLKAETTSGSIEIIGVTADALNLSATNQNITVNGCDFRSTDISNVSGATDIKDSSLGGGGKIAHTSGNINLTNCVTFNDFKIKGSCALTNCTLGDNNKIENMSGGVKVGRTSFIGLEISSTSGDITVGDMIKIDLCNFEINAASGSIKVNGTNQGTVYNVTPSGWLSRLKINATSGNVKIN